jgi:hypothetical protein
MTPDSSDEKPSVSEACKKVFQLGANSSGQEGKGYVMLFRNADEDLMKEVLKWKTVVWLAQDAEIEGLLVNPGPKPSLPALLCRLFGGCIVGPEWLHASERCGRMVKPILHLAPGLATPLDFCLRGSLPIEVPDAITKRFAITTESPEHRVRWTFREFRRSQLPGPQASDL